MESTTKPAAVLPKGSWILLTGAAGYVGSHVIIQLLQRGYEVRGTARDVAKSAWLLAHPLTAEYAARGALELVQVPDLAAPGAYDAALRGVSAVVHVAADNNLEPDPNSVIPKSTAAIVALLRAAAREPSVRRFVYTSSSFDVAFPAPGVELAVGRDTWNEAAVRMAWAPPPYDGPERALFTYVAAKVETHRALWRFVAEERPPFVVNSVGPYMAAGQPLHEAHLARVRSVQFFKLLWEGKTGFAAQIPAIYYTHVGDLAVVHVAATLDAEVEGRRINAWARSMNWNDALHAMRKLFPEHALPKDPPDPGQMAFTLEDTVAGQLVRKWSSPGGAGWAPLEDGIQEMVDYFEGYTKAR